MLDTYLVDNYNKLKDMAYNITSGKGNKDLLSFDAIPLADRGRLTFHQTHE